VVDHHLNRLVGGQEAVFDAVDAGADAGLNRLVPDGMCGHSHPGAMGFVGESRRTPRPNTVGRPGRCCAT